MRGKWVERIYLARIKGVYREFFCVGSHHHENFKSGGKFVCDTWKFMEPISEQKPESLDGTEFTSDGVNYKIVEVKFSITDRTD